MIVLFILYRLSTEVSWTCFDFCLLGSSCQSSISFRNFIVFWFIFCKLINSSFSLTSYIQFSTSFTLNWFIHIKISVKIQLYFIFLWSLLKRYVLTIQSGISNSCSLFFLFKTLSILKQSFSSSWSISCLQSSHSLSCW